MNQPTKSHAYPAPHPIPQVDAIRPYITDAVSALLRAGFLVARSWLDPMDPLDATIVLESGHALVWVEERGWRVGTFRAGGQGQRTLLHDPMDLNGGPGLTASELVHEYASYLKEQLAEGTPQAQDLVVAEQLRTGQSEAAA